MASRAVCPNLAIQMNNTAVYPMKHPVLRVAAYPVPALLLVLLLAGAQALAQAPETFSYQAVARDGGGQVVPNATLGVQFQLHSGAANGPVVYAETHAPTTNAQGLFSVHVGQGTPTSGTFAAIDWGATSVFLEVGLDPAGGTAYSTIGTQQLLSVPYALYAATSGSSSADVDEIKDADNDTKIQVEESADEDIIRFDLAGSEMFKMTKLGSAPYLNTAGNNVLIGNGLSASFGGNFNTIMGYQAGAALASGSDNTFLGKGSATSFTTGSANTMIGNRAGESHTIGFSNLYLGGLAGLNKTEGDNNVLLGYGAGLNSGSGSSNVFLGFNAGHNETGSNRLYIENTNSSSPLVYGEFDNNLLAINGTLRVNDGSQANGFVLTSDANGTASWQANTRLTDADNDTKIQVEESADEDVIRFDLAGSEMFKMSKLGTFPYFNIRSTNILIGESISSNITGTYNSVIGSNAGNNLTSGSSNTIFGADAGRQLTTGASNVLIGDLCGASLTTGQENVMLGRYAGIITTTGNSNTFIGTSTGQNNISGTGNVFIGYLAGANETGSDKLYIDNSSTSSPLIYGEFDNNIVRINGKLGVGTAPSTYDLDVNGTGRYTGDLNANTRVIIGGNGSGSNAPLYINGSVVSTPSVNRAYFNLGSVQGSYRMSTPSLETFRWKPQDVIGPMAVVLWPPQISELRM